VCWSCGEPGHFRDMCPYWRKTEKADRHQNEKENLRETNGNRQEGPNGDQETTERWTGGVANCWETIGYQWKRGNASVPKYSRPQLSSQFSIV
jgi:hypothetical protein